MLPNSPTASFLLDLYRARPLSGYVWLHGVRHGRMVHIGGVDSAVSMGDITQIALEFRKADGNGRRTLRPATALTY